MVSGVEEVRKAKAVIHECMDELRRKRIHFNTDIKIGIMIEVPSTCMIAMFSPRGRFLQHRHQRSDTVYPGNRQDERIRLLSV